MTKPSLSLSKGAGVSFGVSFLDEVENMVSKTPASQTDSSSAPPATIAS